MRVYGLLEKKKQKLSGNRENEGNKVEVVNFTLVKKYRKGKEYINCAAYGEKVEKEKDFEKGDLIHIFGYFKKREKEGKTYKYFVVKSYNKIEKKEENEEEEVMEFITQIVNVLKILVMAEGYYVSTVGLNESTIRKYIREQESHDIAMDKLTTKEYTNPFVNNK